MVKRGEVCWEKREGLLVASGRLPCLGVLFLDVNGVCPSSACVLSQYAGLAANWLL